jgi:hypothetical protein
MRKKTLRVFGRLIRLGRAARKSGRESVNGRVADAEPRLPLFASGDPHLAEWVDENLVGFGER